MPKYLYIPVFLILSLVCCSSIRNSLDFANQCAMEGLWDEAIYRWERALADNPGSAAIHNNLAVAYEKKGELDKARQEYQKALQLAPGNEQIKKNYEKFSRKDEKKTEGGDR